MSTTIDQRVVEMRFDNAHFEKNVSKTMSTLDKLKQKLNLSGASKGLEEVGSAAKKVDMSGLGNGIETVTAKFSALQVMGITALTNITNSAVNAGKRMISALTIDPIRSGFQEYETQINAVQTILANTSSKGSTIKDVNKALDELNKYADQTIYNFTEMTRNIGTFTAAGVDLDTSVSAIKGIANLAAVSGSTSQQASTAMYQLSQALAAGTVKLQDWNSVVNAGMGGEVFQNALKRTAQVMGTDVDALIEKYGSFRESLSRGEWLTTDVLTETLNQFTMAAEEGTEQWEEYKNSLKEKGYTEEQANEILKMANTATDAATKVKTFTQLWDVLKESAQSGWAQTWKLIFGDFEQAKAFFTPLADFLTGVINKISDARNALIESAFGQKIKGLTENIKSIASPLTKTADSVKAVVDSVKDYGKVVDEIIGGKWGNGQARWDALAKSGYDWAHAQNLVNEKLGDATRHATDYKEAQNGVVETQKELTETQEKLTEAEAKQISQLAKKSDAELESLGYTKKQIEAFNELEKTAKKLGLPIEELITYADEINGRWLFINSFKNIGESIVKIFKAIGEAWRDAFPPMQATTLFNIIAGLHKFSSYLEMSDKTAENLTRTLKGVFAIIDIVATLTGGVFKIGLEIVEELFKVLGYAGGDILSITAVVGDAIVAFRNWFEKINPISIAIRKLAPLLVKAGQAMLDLIDDIKGSKAFKQLSDYVKSASDAIEKFFNKIKEIKSVPKDIIAGLKNGLSDGVESVISTMLELGERIIEAIKKVLGIHSPSTVMMAIGSFIIAGLVIGMKNGLFTELLPTLGEIGTKIVDGFKAALAKTGESSGSFISSMGEAFGSLGKVFETIFKMVSGFVSKIVELISEVDFSTLVSAGVSVGLLYTVKKISDAFNILASPLEGFGELMESTADLVSKTTRTFKKVLKSFANVMNSFAFSVKAKALQNIAIALAILVGSIIVLTFIDTDKLWDAVGIVAVLAAILSGLVLIVEGLAILSKTLDAGAIEMGSISIMLLSVAASILLISAAVKQIGKLTEDQAMQGFAFLLMVVLSIGSLMVAYGAISKYSGGANIDKIGGMLLKISASLLLMIAVIKLAAKLENDEIDRGVIFIAAFTVFVLALSKISEKAGDNISKIGGLMIKISLALLLMVAVVKIINLLDGGEMLKGAIFAAGFAVFVGVLVGITKTNDDKARIIKLGGLLLAVSSAMLIMAIVIKMISQMEWHDLAQGLIGIGIFTLIIKSMINMVKTTEKNAHALKAGGTILGMATAIGIMAGACILLGMIDLGKLAKGLIAVGFLGAIIAGMTWAARGVGDIKGTFIGMAVAIGVMAASMAALSLIDPEKLYSATLALSAVLGMFAVVIHEASGLQKCMGSLIVLTVAVGLIGGMLIALAHLPIESTLAAAAGISVLLLSMSVAMALLNKPSFISPMSLVAIGILTLVVGALGGILYLLKDLPVESTMATATSISTLLIALSACCLILTAVGLGGPAALIGIGSLAALIVGIGGLMVAIGALTDHFPKMEEFLDKGIVMLEKIGHGLGSFFRNIVGGFLDGATSGLPELATTLSEFMTNISGFVEGSKSIDSTASEGISSLVKMVKMLAGANITESIASFLTGESSMTTFATQLNGFGDAIVEFSAKVKGNIDESSVLAAANAGKLLAEMQNMISGTEGVVQWFSGERDLANFGEQIKAYGEAIVGFSKYIVENGGVDESAVTAAVNAGKVMAELQTSIEPMGGVVDVFTGQQNLATFGTQLVAYGIALTAFSDIVSKEGAINETAITAAKNAGMIMTELQKAIEPTEGVVQWFSGTTSLETFGNQLVAYGQAIAAFSKSISGENAIDEAAIQAAANAGEVMAKVQKAIPEDKWFDGKVSIDDFGDKLVGFGESIVEYSDEVVGIDVATIMASTTAAELLTSIAKKVAKIDGDEIGKFEKVKKIGSGLNDYYKKVVDVNISTIHSSIDVITKLVNLINDMVGIDTSGASSFRTAMSILGKTNVEGVVEAFSGAANQLSNVGTNLMNSIVTGFKNKQSLLVNQAKVIVSNAAKQMNSKASEFNKIGVNLMNALVKSITAGKSKVNSAIRGNMSGAVSTARTYYTSFYNAGSYLVKGFASGISENTWRAEAKAKAMADAAEKAAKKALDINSPSKVFRALGYSVPEGFAMGIDKLSNLATNSANSMANSAIGGVKKSISNIANVVSGDIDFQPTIRPVLDLSDVKSGAESIGNLFSGQNLVGITANVNAVNAMMNQRNQNGANDDVVSAIDKLRGALGNLTNGNTYNINGITYDDGSSVSDAISTLVRYAVIEGRA